jgi:hypothetical protein
MPTDFSKIIYDNSSHSYKINNQSLTSVTTVIGRLAQPFDKETISRRVALRDGITEKEVLKLWEHKGKLGREKGDFLHKYVEDVISGIRDPIKDAINERIPEMTAFDRAWLEMQTKLQAKLLYKELIVGDEELGVAGRVDAVIEVTVDGQRTICIFDWKTGKFDITGYDKLLSPFHTFDDCKFNMYSLQTSLYRLIIERNSGKQMCDPYVCHFRDDPPDGKYFKVGYKLHRARDFRKQLQEWLLNGGGKIDMMKEKEATVLIDVLSKKVDSKFVSCLSESTLNKLLRNFDSCGDLIRNILVGSEDVE